VPFPDRLPRPELHRQVPPRNARPEPVDRTLHQLAVARHRPTHRRFQWWQQWLDPRPRLIRQNSSPRHPPIIGRQARSTWETRPRTNRRSRTPSVTVSERKSMSGPSRCGTAPRRPATSAHADLEARTGHQAESSWHRSHLLELMLATVHRQRRLDRCRAQTHLGSRRTGRHTDKVLAPRVNSCAATTILSGRRSASGDVVRHRGLLCDL